MSQYFHKEILANAVYHQGKPLLFTPVEDANGILQTDDAELAAKLTEMASRRVGGIQVLTRERYEELKKKPTVKLEVTETRYGNSGPRLIANSVPMSKASQPVAAAPVPGQESVKAAGAPAPAVPVTAAASSVASKPKIASRKGRASAPSIAKPEPTV